MKFLFWFGFAFTVHYLVYSNAEEYKCLTDSETGIERHFWVNEFDLPFRIEVSNRPSHKLISYILKILLKEVIGYPFVYLKNQDTAVGDDPTTTLEKISSCETIDQGILNCSEVDSYGPELMVNLEVWLTPGHSLEKWIATGQVDVVGPLGPIGRIGWYIAEYAVIDFWEKNQTVIDHWRAFTYPYIVEKFDITEEIAKQYTTENNYCTLEECGTDSIYRPEKCLQTAIKCATLLADYPASNFEKIKNDIRNLGLLVNVAFVGKELDDIVKRRTEDRKNTLFFHSKPMVLINDYKFVHVKFPSCEDDSTSECGFEIYQLEKIAWSKVRTHAPHANYVIQSMFFPQSEYLELLQSYMTLKSRGYEDEKIACKWIKDNMFLVLQNWIPVDHRKKTTLHIGGIFPETGLYWRQKSVIEAAYMAAEAINESNDILANYRLEILSQDGQCAADEVMKSFINYVTNSTYSTMVGILGPACSDTVEPIAGVAKHFNSIIISYSAEGALFSNREKYPYFFRTIPENNQFRSVYLKLFQKLGFSRVAALTEDGQKYTEYISHLQDSMQELGMNFIVNRKFPREKQNLNMSLYLKELKDKGARIIIGDFYDYAARAVMCAAYELEMTASHGYVWFLPLWFTSNWYDTNSYNLFASEEFERVTCTTEQMVESISGHISLAYKFYADPDTIIQDGRNVSEWKESYDDRSGNLDVSGSRYGGYTYDAVWVYATALDALFKENKSHVATLHSDKTSRRLMELIKETNFTGVTGPLYFLGSSRISDIVISQWYNHSYRRIGLYHPDSHSDGYLELNESEIKWLTPGGIKPEDGTMEVSNCSVEMIRRLLHTSCEIAVIVANGLGVSVFIIIICFCGAVYKHRYDKKLKKREKRWKELGLMENNGQFALDEWEMPRDHIVINRKLGEGAFGAVFGGEAKLKDGGWVAVAVKTLKNGSKQEEKLNFLSEAEIMKQFDHVNIVKLVGVCTTSEPVYTVMEFMLYGDLKTYLLSRRSIAAEKDRSNNDEVSDRRLTNMALDIARGLSYLACKKIVHRDLACRNCLVNISRSVKIADFGMCRAMYDSDYYRYNKKGMLPVRWMAPESLIDGLFTPMSDIWSYGVVLYEIVTFASVPYQGLSNNQVLERIKSFQILSVPQGIKLQLNALLQQCWSRSPQQRPQAVEIVETLANNPELISPCLDVPMSSVQVMDTGTFELTVHDRTRVHSLSSIWQNRKNMVSAEQIDNVLSDRPNLPSNTHDNGGILKSGFKFSNKKTLHESFSRKKRDLHRDKVLDMPPQTTYL